MTRGIDAAIGFLAVVGLAIALVLGLQRAAGGEDLRVSVRAPAPFEIAPGPRAPLAPAVAGPPSLLPRLSRGWQPDREDPGLWLRTWQVTYGHRWERQVTWPVLAGPFDPEGKPWPCAIAVRLSPRFFDDDKPGGEDVASVVDARVRALFPFSVMGLHFAKVASTSLHVRPVEGGLLVSGGVVLADGKRDPTAFSIRAKIVIGERDGDLTARIERVDVAWSGRTRRDPLVELASIFLDVDDQARRIVSEKLAAALAIVRLPREPIAVFADRPADRYALRLCDAPEAHANGLTVRLRIVANLAEPRVDPRVPGPPHLEAPPQIPPPTEQSPTFEASASAAAVQQALYATWQSGELRAWGRDPRVIAALERKLADRLAIDLGPIDAHLPPVVLPDANALRVRFGAMDIGRAGGRRVMANGDVGAVARIAGGSLGLSGTLADVRVTCVEGEGADVRLSPCFSDVVPALRENGLNTEGLPLDLAVPDRLMRIHLFLGTDLVLRGIEGEVSGHPPELRVRGEARLVKRSEPL